MTETLFVEYGRITRSDLFSSTSNAIVVDSASLVKHDLLPDTDAFRLMLASEKVLSKYWDSPEEDEAWAYL